MKLLKIKFKGVGCRDNVGSYLENRRLPSYLYWYNKIRQQLYNGNNMILETTYTKGETSILSTTYRKLCVPNWLFDLSDLQLSFIPILI